MRRYSGPICSEVAAVISGAEDGIVHKQDIVLRKTAVINVNRIDAFDTISLTRCAYVPLC